MKKILIPLVAVVVIAGVAYALMQQKTNTVPAQQKTPEQTSNTFDPKNPNFILGTVTNVSANQIDFTEGLRSFSAQVSAKTKFVKQVKDGNGIKNVDITISDVKSNQQIVIYFSSNPKDGVYQADKVQIISQ